MCVCVCLCVSFSEGVEDPVAGNLSGLKKQGPKSKSEVLISAFSFRRERSEICLCFLVNRLKCVDSETS